MNLIAEDHALKVLEACRNAHLMITTAESCTGGLIAAALTDIAGSSDVVDCGFITYSNEAKSGLIGVPQALIRSFGAVSEQVAIAMAEGALKHAPQAGISIAVTGVAGPGGGTDDKPVGLVHLACARAGFITLHQECRFGDQPRSAIRLATVTAAFDLILDHLKFETLPD
ncbi:Nicotinamide-nucleotide amidohydrolase PncC [Pseudochrobactrum sp. MP213Fo]